MFNTKKLIRDLESRVESLENVKVCQDCKCLLYKKNAKVIIVMRYVNWHVSLWPNITNEYFCQRCKPAYDEIDKRVTPHRFFKNVDAHKVEIKN